ncbi:MAG: Ig-like domain repeat protein [Solirubrobacteraceae bacterium]
MAWCAATATASAAGPVDSTPPTLAGIAQQGQSLTLTPGKWTDATAVTVSDVWESCVGASCSAISPQPGASYTLTAADVGRSIEVVETATATDGTATLASTPTATVIALPPVNPAPPTTGGTAQEGQVLTLTQGQWSNSPTISDQWQRCTGAACSPISGETGTTHTVTAADVGQSIEVLETATNSGGTASISSAPTAVIVAPPTEIAAPSIMGTASQGSLLTEVHATWTGAPTSFAYQWYRCSAAACVPISGATSQTYTPVAADVGSGLLVAEVATNAGGPSAPADSALTSVVTGPLGPTPVNISPPSISGVAQQGQTLTEAHGSWSGNPTSYRYQWDACGSAGCADIPGATGSSYTLTAADVGKNIVALESASNAAGIGTPAASARTSSVTTTVATSLAVLPNNPITNQQATLVATVTSGSANAHPSGSLTFSDGGRVISGCANKILQASAQSATFICQSSFAAGTSQLTVAFSPATGTFVVPSVSAPVTLDVGRDATSTSLAVTKQVQRAKQATYAATIVLPLSNSGPLEPTGAVRFLDHGRPIPGCMARPLSQLVATCVTSYRSVGTHQISARYVGDLNFAPSTSPSRSMRVVEHSSRPAVLGFVSSTLQWQFQYHPTYTVVTGLEADRLATGMTVVLACRGPSCPFKRVRFPVPAGASTIDLRPTFHKRRLRPGSEITVRITHSHWIGKYYAFTVRPGRGPTIVLSCLGVGQARPGSGC